MNSLFIYLLQASIVFSVVFIIYRLLFSKLTFHKLNRSLLLFLVPLSLAIPLGEKLLSTISIQQKLSLIEHIRFDTLYEVDTMLTNTQSESVNYLYILMAIYALGVSIHLLGFVNAARKLWHLKKNSKTHQKKGYVLVESNITDPFSFFHWIFLPQKETTDKNSWVLAHEKAHVSLRHTWDVVLTELYIAFFWFNPLVYFFRRSVKTVHEFQADKAVLDQEVKLSEYMYLLLESLKIEKPNALYSYFHYPLLKKRIDMMTKNNSKDFLKMNYLIMIPVCALLLFSFAEPVFEQNETVKTEKTTTPSFTFPVEGGTKKDISSFFGVKREHPLIKNNKAHKGIDIKAKNGTPVLASEDGLVLVAEMKDSWGNLVVVKHSEGFETWYAHLQGFNTQKKKQVKKGEIIGYIGETGKSTGAHLHFEIKKDNQQVDPLDYLK